VRAGGAAVRRPAAAAAVDAEGEDGGGDALSGDIALEDGVVEDGDDWAPRAAQVRSRRTATASHQRREPLPGAAAAGQLGALGVTVSGSAGSQPVKWRAPSGAISRC